MSWEEDYLIRTVRELEKRIEKLEAACPGASSSTSPASQTKSSASRKPTPRKPARTTESP